MLSVLPLVGIALLFWLFIIRPASRRQKELRSMQSSLSVGDEVVLTSGVYGSVASVEDDHVLLQVADGVVLKVARAAIGSVVTSVDDEVEEEPVDGSTAAAPTKDESGVVTGPEES